VAQFFGKANGPAAWIPMGASNTVSGARLVPSRSTAKAKAGWKVLINRFH
jgi:hypothetical protein